MDYPKIFHDNRLDDAAPVASTTAAGFDAANLLDWRPNTQWQPTALPATVRVDSGSARAADYCVVWEHNLFTQGATFNVRRSPLGTWAGGDDVLVATLTPTNDKPFLIEFASVASQHWGLEITGATMPSIGIAAIGAALEIPAGLREGFDPLGRTPKGRFNRSVTGIPLGRTIEFEEWSQSLTFELLTWDWMRATWLPAWQAHLRGEPFVFAWDAAGHPGELALVDVKAGFKGPHKAGSVGDLSVTLTGLLA